MSKEKSVIDFKLARFTRLITGPAEMTKGSKGDAAAATTATEGAGATQASATTATATAPGGKTTGDKGGNSQASRNLMKNFLTAAATPPVKRGRDEWAASPRPDQAAKRAQQKGDEDDRDEEVTEMVDLEDEEIEEEEDWQKQLRKTMMKAAGLTPEQAKICMQHIRKTFKDRVGEEAKKVAKKVVRDEQELGKCRRSILMHNADKWVEGDVNTRGYSLAERVTSAIHRISGGMVMVMDCFAIGAWQAGRMPSSVYLTFGSAQQKTTFFRIMANRIRYGDEKARIMRVVACRDAFPKEHVPVARELAQKGMGLRREGQVASFRVVSRGTGCIPVLEVKEWMESGQAATRWTVFQDTAAGAARADVEETPAVNNDNNRREEDWQTVTSKRNQRAAGKAKQATPAKVATTGTNLSVAKPTLSPKGREREDQMESEEDIVRLPRPEGADEYYDLQEEY